MQFVTSEVIMRPKQAGAPSACYLVARRYVWFSFVEFGKLRRRIVQGDAAEPVTFAQCQGAETGLANARGILQHFLEHRRKLAG